MLTEMLSELRYRLRALVRREALDRELDEELRFHLEQETGKLVGEGMPRAEAERRARVAFGGVDRITEDARDARGVAWIESAAADLRYAARGLRAHPTFALGVVITLALGIGANAAIFGIVDRLLFRPPPYLADAERVHRVYLSWNSDGERRTVRNLEFARYLDLRRWTRAFDEVVAFQTRQLAIGEGDELREMPVTVASAAYFELFEARPALGRFFSAAEDSVPMGTPVVVLGHAFWRTRYGGRTDILGEEIRIGRTTCTIVGVAPEGFVGMSDQGVPVAFMPITAYAWGMRAQDYSANYNWSWLELVVRRRADASEAAAGADLADAFRRSWVAEAELGGAEPHLELSRPDAALGPVQFGRGPVAGPEARVVRWVGGVALVVLLIACANVANLLLSRAVSRRREIAMRLALGASRGRLVRQLLTESLVLAALGGAAGLLLAQWGGEALRTLFLSADDPSGVVTDGRTLAFAAAATLATSLLTGLVPALQAGRDDLARAVRGGARDGGQQRTRMRTALVLVQAALSVVLLVGAGLLVRSLHHVRTLRLGYDVDALLYAEVNLRGATLDSASAERMLARLLETAQATPGVAHASLASSVPFWSNESRGLIVPGVDSVDWLGSFVMQAASADYFATTGTRILRGRAFGATDRAHTPRVAVVSEGMARALWPGEDAIGRCFTVRLRRDSGECTRVIGVAEEVRIRRLDDAREYAYYLPLAQLGEPASPQLFARVSGRPEDHADALRRRLQAELPGAAYASVVPLRSLVDPNFRSWRFGATMFVAFGTLALALATVGLYGVVAYGVAQRVPEMGIRIALGAPIAHVVGLVVVGSLRVVVAGIALGGAAALWGARWLEPVLFRQSARDPAIFGAVAAALLLAALVASLAPAVRAARVDPNAVLRAE